MAESAGRLWACVWRYPSSLVITYKYRFDWLAVFRKYIALCCPSLSCSKESNSGVLLHMQTESGLAPVVNFEQSCTRLQATRVAHLDTIRLCTGQARGRPTPKTTQGFGRPVVSVHP